MNYLFIYLFSLLKNVSLGRILYAILEHSYDDTMYDDDQRAVMHLPACIAGIKAGIIPLLSDERLSPFLQQLCNNNNNFDIHMHIY